MLYYWSQIISAQKIKFVIDKNLTNDLTKGKTSEHAQVKQLFKKSLPLSNRPWVSSKGQNLKQSRLIIPVFNLCICVSHLLATLYIYCYILWKKY